MTRLQQKAEYRKNELPLSEGQKYGVEWVDPDSFTWQIFNISSANQFKVKVDVELCWIYLQSCYVGEMDKNPDQESLKQQK